VGLVAINKNDTTGYSITGLNTALPPCTYSDYLGGLLNGGTLTVTTGSGGNNPATAFTLGPSMVAVWQKQVNATTPEVGSVGPYLGQPGMTITIAGDGFGTTTGSVLFGTATAVVKSWTNSSVTVTVLSVSAGAYSVTVKNAAGTQSNGINFNVLTGKLVPVTFTVNNAQPTNAATTFSSVAVFRNSVVAAPRFRQPSDRCSTRTIRTGFLMFPCPRVQMFNMSTSIFDRTAMSSGSPVAIIPTRYRPVALDR
jgi:hypothetical protein